MTVTSIHASNRISRQHRKEPHHGRAEARTDPEERSHLGPGARAGGAHRHHRAVGDNALTVYYKTADGKLLERMLFRTDEAKLSLAEAGRPWAFDAR
jgi:hypothetical protein